MLRQGLRALSGARLARVHGGATTRHARTAATQAIARATPAPPGDGPNHRSVMNLDAHTIRPYVQPDAFVAPSASIIGSVVINSKASVLYGAVVRGDLALIHLGMFAQVGDNAVLTAGRVTSDGRATPRVPDASGAPDPDGDDLIGLGHAESLTPGDAVATGLPIEPGLFVGDYCTIGANARVHGAHLAGDNVVGAGASVGDGVRVERYGTVLPGSWVADGTMIGEGEVWGGAPATKVGEVSGDERIARRQEAMGRHKTTARHMFELLPVGTVYWEKEAMARKR